MFDHDRDPAYPFRPAPPPPPGPSRGAQFLALALIGLLIVGLVGLYVAPSLVLRWRSAEAQAEAEAAYLKRQAQLKAESEAADKRLAALDGKIKLTSLSFREVARKVLPSVVNVSNEREVPREALARLRGATLFYDYKKDRVYQEVGVGSGIIVRPGLVLTNHHVVKGAERLRVTFASGDWEAVEVGTRSLAADPLTDLAVIRLEDDPSRHKFDVSATFADSDKDLQVGDWALAVGSPLGLDQTVTAGIISYKGRALSNLDLVEVLQTDAAINPGNSGGPLFDQYGRVVGINVAIASRTGGNQGIGFAIPSNTARDIFRQLAENGEVVRGFIGVGLQPLPLSEIEKLKLGDTGGVLVKQVVPGLPAAQAGITAGDIVIRYNHKRLGLGDPMRRLRKMILETKPGEVVPVEIYHQGDRLTKDVTIGKRPQVPQ